MRDRIFIFAGVLFFLVVFTFPVWRSLGSGATTAGPQLQAPADASECVAARQYMRESHMKLLLDWRTGLVRRQHRSYASPSGRLYAVSLSNTCQSQCHGQKAEFCDRCHNYVALSTPNCWQCHQDAPLGRSRASSVAPGSR